MNKLLYFFTQITGIKTSLVSMVSRGKHLCQSLFFNKVAGLSCIRNKCGEIRSISSYSVWRRERPATLLKKRLWLRCFPMNFARFLRTSFYKTPLDNCLWAPYSPVCCPLYVVFSLNSCTLTHFSPFSISAPRENVRKPKSFWRFQGYRNGTSG